MGTKLHYKLLILILNIQLYEANYTFFVIFYFFEDCQKC